MVFHSRYWLAAAFGLWMAHPLVAAEPARQGSVPNANTRQQNSQNQKIADIIASHLRQSGNLRQYRIDIRFQNGLAEISGMVQDQMQREEVLRIAQGVPGVERVRDRMNLVSAGPVTRTQALVNGGPDLMALPGKADKPANGIVEPMPVFAAPMGAGPAPGDPRMPGYAWPTYAPYNNYSRVAYPTLYPYQAWPYIGPNYPFPKVPLGWRSVKLQWQDGKWWYGKTATGHDWWRVRYWEPNPRN